MGCIHHVRSPACSLKSQACPSRAPRSRTETLLFPKQACSHLHLRPIEGLSPAAVGLRSDLQNCAESQSLKPVASLLKPAKSAQWESNPHFRHGKAVGCHYIMGAKQYEVSCQRTSEHRAGLEPASPLYESGVFAARPPVLRSQWDQRDSNPHPPG